MKWLCILLVLLLVLPCAGVAEEDYSPSLEGIPTGIVNARFACHDPSILAADGKYYIFGTHMAAAFSEDLRGWSGLANGYSPKNTVRGNLFEEGSHVFDYAGLHLPAPLERHPDLPEQRRVGFDPASPQALTLPERSPR